MEKSKYILLVLFLCGIDVCEGMYGGRFYQDWQAQNNKEATDATRVAFNGTEQQMCQFSITQKQREVTQATYYTGMENYRTPMPLQQGQSVYPFYYRPAMIEQLLNPARNSGKKDQLNNALHQFFTSKKGARSAWQHLLNDYFVSEAKTGISTVCREEIFPQEKGFALGFDCGVRYVAAQALDTSENSLTSLPLLGTPVSLRHFLVRPAVLKRYTDVPVQPSIGNAYWFEDKGLVAFVGIDVQRSEIQEQWLQDHETVTLAEWSYIRAAQVLKPYIARMAAMAYEQKIAEYEELLRKEEACRTTWEVTKKGLEDSLRQMQEQLKQKNKQLESCRQKADGIQQQLTATKKELLSCRQEAEAMQRKPTELSDPQSAGRDARQVAAENELLQSQCTQLEQEREAIGQQLVEIQEQYEALQRQQVKKDAYTSSQNSEHGKKQSSEHAKKRPSGFQPAKQGRNRLRTQRKWIPSLWNVGFFTGGLGIGSLAMWLWSHPDILVPLRSHYCIRWIST